MLFIVVGSRDSNPPLYWMYDWHVHYAGAVDLLERDLYRSTLTLPGWELPTPVFNLPPAAAGIAVPFAVLGRGPGGSIWQLLGLAGLVFAIICAVRVNRIPYGLSLAGIGMLLYAGYREFPAHITLGNVNQIMLAILAGFVWTYLRGHYRIAGALLGLAIAIKVWPLALLPLVLRERQWQALAATSAIILGQGLFFVGWLGIDVLPLMVEQVRTPIEIPPGATYVWTTWAREHWDWWPIWLAPVLGVGIALLPARGRLGLGFGLIGGVMLVSNIWDHYLPTFIFGLVLMGAGALPFVRAQLSRIPNAVGSSRRPTRLAPRSRA